jgi:hypothetical protein
MVLITLNGKSIENRPSLSRHGTSHWLSGCGWTGFAPNSLISYYRRFMDRCSDIGLLHI